ncbi:hypothetical protein CU098_002718, partial [Rhizopus stolonifer]
MIGPEIPRELLKKKSNSDEIVMSDEEESDIGPQIPQYVLEKKREQVMVGPEMPTDIIQQRKNNAEIVMSDEEESDIGPQIPQHVLEKKREQVMVGPEIPRELLKKKSNSDEIVMSDEEESDIGPQIPQQVLQKKRDTAERQMHEGEIIMSDEESDFGPQYLQQKDDLKQEETAVDPDDYTPELPPDLVEHRRTVQSQPGRRRAPIGPSLPSNLLMQSEPDDDMIGPDLPMNYNPEEEAKHSAIHAIEERARQSREAIEKKKEGSTKVERPEWMLAPPEVDYLKTATSSRSRQFSSKPVGAVDSTEWTETPADKE